MNLSRRTFIKTTAVGATSSLFLPSLAKASNGPNILFIMSDDQTWLHAGAYGDTVVKTPTFDYLATNGIKFNHAYCSTPSCTPSRATVLSGQDAWRLGEGGSLYGNFYSTYPTYTKLLSDQGYHVGYTNKGWAPGKAELGGWSTNPCGEQYSTFKTFLEKNTETKPWCFWYGSKNPHRHYTKGNGIKVGLNPDDVTLPPFYPDTAEVRSDFCDYYAEIQDFDDEIQNLLNVLEERNELDNTLIVVTSDNGMPFPRAKANLYDWGTRMPLVIYWKGHIVGGRTVDDFVNLIDFAPTFLELAGIDIPEEMTGKSLVKILNSDQSGTIEAGRDYVVTARERHTAGRPNQVSYPSRAIRTHDYLYIRNYESNRWPAGDPPFYCDIDTTALQSETPTKDFMIANRNDPIASTAFQLSCLKRPSEELYNCASDPYQVMNLADNKEYQSIKEELSQKLTDHLVNTGDPRETGGEVIWDTAPYRGKVSYFKTPLKSSQEFMTVHLDDKLPDFMLKTVNEEDISLAQFTGKIVFLYLFRWDSPTCLEQAKEIEEMIVQKYDNNTYQVIGVDCYDGSDTDLQNFVQETNVSFPVIKQGSVILAKYGLPHFMDIDFSKDYFKSYTLVTDENGLLKLIENGYALETIQKAFDSKLSVKENPNKNLPDSFELKQNFPNPFNNSTTISFSINQSQKVKLCIYNMRGQEVIRLIDRVLPSGHHRVKWDGMNKNGLLVPSGTFKYSLQVNGEKQSKSMLLLK